MRFPASVALLGLVAVASAAEPTVSRLTAFPPALTLRGADDAPQLLVTGQAASDRQLDLTGDAKYTVSNPTIARVDPSGRVYPLANGTAEITAKASGQSVRVPVTVSGTETPLPINFANQVEPVLTKLGCNSGGCHGKIAGQNGFRLSLLGFDPELDYMTLVKESRGRRLFPAAPDQSLFLQKAAGVVPHGGGKKMDVGSEEYKLLRRWIASGMPYGSDSDPTVAKVTVYPDTRVIDRQGRQQLAVHAHYSDGTVEDVTRRAQYESNETEVATVTESGLVQTLSMTGQAAVMVRFSGAVTVFRAVVPRPGPATRFDFEPKTVVDTAHREEVEGTRHRPVGTLHRRAVHPPGVPRHHRHAADRRRWCGRSSPTRTPAKRDKLVDRLVETPEYAYFFANKWADVLRVKRRGQPDRASGTFAFHTWIREAVAADKPYDEFVRDIVCAIGDETKSPPTVWYREVAQPEQFVDDVSQVFLGQRLACANCHHHPYEKWSQDDYWGLAAFFGRVGSKQVPVPGRQNRQSQEQVIFAKPTGSVTNKRTNKPAPLRSRSTPTRWRSGPRRTRGRRSPTG